MIRRSKNKKKWDLSLSKNCFYMNIVGKYNKKINLKISSGERHIKGIKACPSIEICRALKNGRENTRTIKSILRKVSLEHKK